jgi:peptide/nickel transport system permease protein
MLLTLLRRFVQMLFVMLGISIITFAIFFATPGADPSARIAGKNAAPETLEAVRKDFGLDQPLPVQYVLLMKRLFVTQDLTSFVNRGSLVVPEIVAAMPVTLSLVFGAALLWVVGALAMGLAAAAWRGSWVDKALTVIALVGISMPVFWLGPLVNLVTQSRYHDTWLFSWVPPLGYVALADDPAGWFKCLVLPCATLAVLYVGLYARVLRGALIEADAQDFIRTARAKGLSERRVLLHHALRSSLLSVVTLFGLDFGVLVGGGALITEVVFGLPGIGKLTFGALLSLDLPVIMATVMYASFFVVAANAAVDALYAFVDPRVRDD